MSNLTDTDKYEAIREIVQSMWEWRHKVMTQFFVVSGSTFIAATWLYKNTDVMQWSYVPFLLGAVFAFISALLDRSNTIVLRTSYSSAAELEKASETPGVGNVFTNLNSLHYRTMIHFKVMRIVYYGSVVVFLSLAVFSFSISREADDHAAPEIGPSMKSGVSP